MVQQTTKQHVTTVCLLELVCNQLSQHVLPYLRSAAVLPDRPQDDLHPDGCPFHQNIKTLIIIQIMTYPHQYRKLPTILHPGGNQKSDYPYQLCEILSAMNRRSSASQGIRKKRMPFPQQLYILVVIRKYGLSISAV